VFVLIVLFAAGYAGWTLWKNTAPSAPLTQPITNPFGAVTAKTSDGFTILGAGDKSISIRITAQTQFLMGTSVKSATDVAVGTIVSIASSTPNADGSVTALIVQILPPPPIPPSSSAASR